MKEFNIPNATEQTAVCRSLMLVAKTVSEGMETFVQRSLTVFAAGLTFLFSQQRVSLEAIKLAGLIFIAATIVALIQRYLVMMISVGKKTFDEASKIHNNKVPLNLKQFLIINIDSLNGLQKLGGAYSARRLMAGDLIATGKGLMVLARWQGVCAFLSVSLQFTAAYFAFKAVTPIP